MTHGEPGAIAALTELVSDDDPSLSIVTPKIGECYQLQSGTPAKLAGTARTDAAQLIGRDWQNDYADFAVSLKRQLARISETGNRQKAITEMRRVLERYSDVHDSQTEPVRD